MWRPNENLKLIQNFELIGREKRKERKILLILLYFITLIFLSASSPVHYLITCEQHIFNVCSLKSRENRRAHKAYILWPIICMKAKRVKKKFCVINAFSLLSQLLKEQKNRIFIICCSLTLTSKTNRLKTTLDSSRRRNFFEFFSSFKIKFTSLSNAWGSSQGSTWL